MPTDDVLTIQTDEVVTIDFDQSFVDVTTQSDVQKTYLVDKGTFTIKGKL